MNNLLTQWQDDCERLSNPHLQWKFKSKKNCNDWENLRKYHTLETVTEAIEDDYFDFRRIESLALPFDFDDAVNGGLVEVRITSVNQWLSCFVISKSNIADLYNIRLPCGLVTSAYSGDLQMKESRLKTTGELKCAT